MAGLKVCVYAICKNEEKFADRWVDSMEEADMILVTDTGSEDGTVEKLRKRGVAVYTDRIVPWRFDRARNSCLERIPEDVDICVSTDLDEVFEPGWRSELEKAWREDTTRLMYHFTWSFNEDGTPGVTFMYDRIHARKGYEWFSPAHEFLGYTGSGGEKKVWCPAVRLGHYPDAGKDRSFYLPLLQLAVEEKPEEPRNYHYLGREYMFSGMWDLCIGTLKAHLDHPHSRWKEERAASMRFIARSYKAKNDFSQAKSWLYRAMAEAPGAREAYVEMAKLMYEQEEWTGVFHMVAEALKIKERSGYINDVTSWDYTLYDLGAISSYRLGLYEKSGEFARMAARMAPHDERLKNNLLLIEKNHTDEKGPETL